MGKFLPICPHRSEEGTLSELCPGRPGRGYSYEHHWVLEGDLPEFEIKWPGSE